MPDPTPSKLSRSWLLFTTSLQVVRQNKRLLLFPVVTSVCSVVMLLFFVAPAVLYPSGHALQELVLPELQSDAVSLRVRCQSCHWGWHSRALTSVKAARRAGFLT